MSELLPEIVGLEGELEPKDSESKGKCWQEVVSERRLQRTGRL